MGWPDWEGWQHPEVGAVQLEADRQREEDLKPFRDRQARLDRRSRNLKWAGVVLLMTACLGVGYLIGAA